MQKHSIKSPPSLLAFALSSAAVVAAFQFGCATAQPMQSSTAVPAAQGTVDATEGDNGNTALAVRVEHLAQPSMIAPDASVYVVWIQPRNGAKQNVGALTLDDELEGVLETKTPHRRFTVSVTPESSGKVAQPTNKPVFTASVDLEE